MKTKLITTIMITLFLASMLSMAFNVAPVSATAVTDVYVSDESDLWWSGATQDNIDGSGYVVPPDGTWQSAVFCWEHPSWNPMLNPADRKAKLFETPSADWTWKAYKVTLGESYTGDIVFFKKLISIPDNAFNIEADFFVITADNVYYFYVNDDWSGSPVGIANFAPAYDPTNFYYVADGTDKSGGDNSVLYETVGNLYPLEASMGWPQSGDSQWWNIEQWNIGNLLHPGVNWLQIVAINEHAPPGGSGEINPAGLIYKVEVTYELATIEKTLSLSEGELGDVITVRLDVEVPTGLTVTVVDTLPPEWGYIQGTFKVDGVSATPTVTTTTPPPPISEVISYTITTSGTFTIEFDAKVTEAYWEDRTVTNRANATWYDELGNIVCQKEATADFIIYAFEELQKGARPVLFSDTFSAAGGNEPDNPWTPVSGTWTVEAGEYKQSEFIYIPGGRSVAGDTAWTDYTVLAKVKVVDGSWGRWGGILLRVADPGTLATAGTYYELYLQALPAWATGRLQLVKTIAGARTAIVNPPVGKFWDDDWWCVKGMIRTTSGGARILGKAWKAGTAEPSWQIDWTDSSPISNGKIGLITFGQLVYFDDVLVTGPLLVPIKEKTNVQWALEIEVTNPFSYTMTNVVIKDRFGAEIEIDTPFPYSITHGTVSYTTEGKSAKVFLTWNIGNLLPGETARLIILVSTDINPAGKQEYTKPGVYELNSGATLKFIDPIQSMQLSAVTAPIYVTVLPAEDP